MDASTRALCTVELLEDVLLYLPPRDLLLAQRVSRHWNGVICESTRIQRALFFTPAQGETLILGRDDHHAKNHLVQLEVDGETKVVRNKLLDPLFRVLESKGDDYSLAAGLPSPWRHEKASWRRMLPAQPALVTPAHVCLWGLPRFWCFFYTEKDLPLICTKDVRIGELFDELEEKFGCFPYGKKKIVIVGLGLNDRLREDQE